MAGVYGSISLSDGVIEYAKTHEEIKGAFLTFQKDADQIYPGWKEKLGYTGESSVQAASFDWKKKAAAAAFVGASASASSARVQMKAGYDDVPCMPDYYEKPVTSFCNQEFVNEVGYLPDGTAMNKAGNLINHSPNGSGPDMHMPGSPLPPPLKGFVNDIGFLPDGTPMDTAGNLANH